VANFTEKVKIEVVADTRSASDDIKHLGDDVKALGDKPVEIATEFEDRAARAGLGDLVEDIRKAQEKSPVKIDVVVNEETAKRSFKSVEDGASKAGASGGGRFGESFIRDLGGTLSPNNQQIVGMGADLAAGIETGFAAIGQEALAGPLLSALGIGTVVVVAAQQLWSVLQQGAEGYKKEVAAAKTVQEELFAGERLQAAKKFQEQWGGLVTTAEKLAGFSPEQVFKFIQGADDPAISKFIDDIREANAKTLSFGGNIGEGAKKLGDLADGLDQARGAAKEGGAALQQTNQQTLALLKATGATNDELLEYARVSGPQSRKEVLLYLASIGAIPKDVVTQFGSDIDDQELASVKGALDNAAKDRTATVHVKLDQQQIREFNRRVPPEDRIPTVSSSTVINNFPPTLSPVRVSRAAKDANRRNGALQK